MLLALRPTHPDADADGAGDTTAYALLASLWWLLMLPAFAVGVLWARRWAATHAPPQATVVESWVPWMAEQMLRGATESELRECLFRALPPTAVAASYEKILEAARLRAAQLDG